MLGALTPPGKVVHGRRRWIENVTAFTLAGLFASAFVGALLAGVGMLLDASLAAPWAAWAAVGLAGLAAARELRVLRLPLPQARRASNGAWARLGQPWAAILWGFDIGLFFTTWLTFAGTWWLAGVALLSADPIYSVGVLGIYWIGRTLAVWLGLWLIPSATITPRLVIAWHRLGEPFRTLHAGVVLFGGIVLGLAAVLGAS